MEKKTNSTLVTKERLAYLEQLEQEKEVNDLKEKLPHLYLHKFYKWQAEYFKETNRKCWLTCANQIGKILSNNTYLPTPKGWVLNGSIKVNDIVFGRDGKPTRVLKVFPHKDWQFYTITFDDGSTIEAGLEHKWICKTGEERFRKKSHGKLNPKYNKWKILNTEEIINAGRYSPKAKSNWYKVSIPVCEPVEYPEKQFKIDPYLLGLLLGDGCMTKKITSTTGDMEIAKNIGNFNYRFGQNKYQGAISNIVKDIRELGLLGTYSNTKFIPSDYLLGSIEQRLDLLRGLMDTDGSIYGKNTLEYCTVSEKLKDGFIELINSLGGILNKVTEKDPFYYDKNRNKVKCKKAYSIRFRIQVNPFKLKRKADKWRKNIRYRHERIIEKIELSSVEDGTCIMVDNPDHSYLASKNYIVTHNSSAQLIKAIMLATDKSLWPKFFPIRRPTTFWYFYPKKGTSTVEFEEKWKKIYLPKGKFEHDSPYVWTSDFRQKDIHSLKFVNTGVTIYFMSYEMKDMQAVTVDAMFCDEEIPYAIYDEVIARTFATEGVFSCVFTATIGQDWVKRIIEGEGSDRVFPDSWRRQITMYDCQLYEDGTPTKFTDAFINRRKHDCSSEIEIQRRVYGKFVIAGGLIYTEYKTSEHYVKPHPLPSNWLIYAGIDMGSGGECNHPAAIAFVAVHPEMTKGRIFKVWRGDNTVTTATDILDKYIKLSKGLNVVRAVYDYAGQGQDFKVVADSRGIPVVPADKRHREEGIDLLNVVFKKSLLKVYASDEAKKLDSELTSLKHETHKTKAKDDLIDSVKYIVREIPWDFSILNEAIPVKKDEYAELTVRERARLKSKGVEIELYSDDMEDIKDIFLSEIDEFNEYHDPDDDF